MQQNRQAVARLKIRLSFPKRFIRLNCATWVIGIPRSYRIYVFNSHLFPHSHQYRPSSSSSPKHEHHCSNSYAICTFGFGMCNYSADQEHNFIRSISIKCLVCGFLLEIDQTYLTRISGYKIFSQIQQKKCSYYHFSDDKGKHLKILF